MNDYNTVKALVKGYLENALLFDWTLQGFGMLRLHLSDEYRLNVWDDRYAVPNVSTIHTHPWDFKSLVVAGHLMNTRFSYTETEQTHFQATIMPGKDFKAFEDEPQIVGLTVSTVERIDEGQTYRQLANEIHRSAPERGSVTLNRRQRVGEDRALVFWETGKEWVSGVPREATIEEAEDICEYALAKWF